MKWILNSIAALCISVTAVFAQDEYIEDEIVEIIYDGNKTKLLNYPEDKLADVTHFSAREIQDDMEIFDFLRRMTSLTYLQYGCDDPPPLSEDIINFIVSRAKLEVLSLEIDARKTEDFAFIEPDPENRARS